MVADSESESGAIGDQFTYDKPFKLFTRVRDAREELGRRIQRMSAKPALTIADRLRLAYYQKTLRFIEPLSPETLYNSGMTIWKYCSDHQEEVREINQILTYLVPEEEITAGAAGSMARALPSSARLFSRKGRLVTQRPAAVRALQLQIDTDRKWKWIDITQEVCDCSKNKHDDFCKEAIRQSVTGLTRLLRELGIEVPKRQA